MAKPDNFTRFGWVSSFGFNAVFVSFVANSFFAFVSCIFSGLLSLGQTIEHC